MKATSSPRQLRVSEHWSLGSSPEVLTDLYHDPVSLACWQRDLSHELRSSVNVLLQSGQTLALKSSGTPLVLRQNLLGSLAGHEGAEPLVDDIHLLLDMFSCLFECATIGLRVNVLDRAMCPRFHVDSVPVRLVTSYGGPGSEWLANHCADRSRLGTGAKGLCDAESGIVRDETGIQQLASGDVALFKGELWEANQGRGLIHRSPALEKGERRLLVTFDIVS